jgi:hypothetical protein
MKPGDLVRVRNLGVSAASANGKVGVIVKVNRRHGEPLVYDVLLDGDIVTLYGIYLELVNETG